MIMIFLIVLMINGCQPNSRAEQHGQQNAKAIKYPCTSMPDSPILTYEIPCDVNTDHRLSPQIQHRKFDYYGWQMFVGLNWPPRENGLPDPHKTIGDTGDNKTVSLA